LALRHRLRRDVLDETGSTVRIERAVAELFG
jgi:magnesium chelatase subunit I